jgi:hypothetical protein
MAARRLVRFAVAVLFILFLLQLATGEHPFEDQSQSGAFFNPLLTHPGPLFLFH